MKKIIISFSLLLMSYTLVYTYDLKNQDIDLANKLIIKIQKKDKSEILKITKNINLIIDSKKYNDKTNAILTLILKSLVPTGEIPTPEEGEGEESNSDGIDYFFVKNNWLTWNNEVRKDLGLELYTVDPILEKSALICSDQAKKKGKISHKRNPGDVFYDYNNINSWFKDQGIVCKNIEKITHTENIWWGGYTCNDGECTEELSQATKRGFDDYMAEKGTPNDAHYRSLTQPYFTKIGVGVSVDEVKPDYFEYYLTIHYCTELN